MLCALLSLVAIACGESRSTGPASAARDATVSDPTLGSSTDTSSETLVDPAGPSLTASGEVPPAPLVAGASAEEILAAVEQAHGPTRDAGAEIRRFGAFPDIATPLGAELLELRAVVRTGADGAPLVVSEATLSVAADRDSVTRFYRRQMDDLGWIGAASEPEPGRPLEMTYNPPEDGFPLDDLAIALEDRGPEATVIRFRHTSASSDEGDTVRRRLEGWAAGLPLPTGGRIIGAGIQTSREGRESLHFNLTVDYGDSRAADLADQLRAALPSGGFELDPKPATGDALDNWVYLTSPFFADVRVSPHTLSDGTTVMNVTARVPFTPRA